MDRAIALAVGLAGGLVLTPLARRIALRTGIVDRPGDLKTQRVPIAYLGGVAVFLAAGVGPILAGEAWILVVGGLALGLGLCDDLRPLPVAPRIGLEVVIALAAAIGTNGPTLARVATAVLVLGLLNAVNLLDGQDGLAAGVGTVICLGFATLGGPGAPVALGTAGALLGFAVFNRPPARIYLGDAGAYFLGTTIALLPGLTAHAPTDWAVWWAVPLLVGVPVIDTAVAILRRARAGQPLLAGDRSHLYDQLVDRGHSVARSTLIGVAAQIVLSTIGIAAARASASASLVITLTTLGVAAALVVRAGFLAPRD